MLHANRQRRGPVFTYHGDAIKIIKTTWASSLRRSGIRHMRFHDLRHTANTRMMLAGVLQEVRRELIGHSSQRSRDVNDRYTQIELPEKREAIRKLEAWLESQTLLLQQGVTAPLLLKSGDQTAPTTEEQTNDGNQHSAPAA
jgi:integrase